MRILYHPSLLSRFRKWQERRDRMIEELKDGKQCCEILSSGHYATIASMNSVAMVTYKRPI